VEEVLPLRLIAGRYELAGRIGQSGWATVYRARDIELGRTVAVKLLSPDVTSEPACRTWLGGEGKAIALLRDPRIAAVYAIGEDTSGYEPEAYVVMEYVDGQTLRERMSRVTMLPERVAAIISDVLLALDCGHRAGIMHRDIKPGNVMITRDDEVKVTDFGIRVVISTAQVALTVDTPFIGTAEYLSPEQLMGGHVDPRSDVYASGCLMYQMLTGEPPFTGGAPVEIAYRQVRESPVPPSQRTPSLPPWADAIVLKAMAKAPDERYQSAALMQADIQRALSGDVLSGQPIAAPPVPQRPGRSPRNRARGLAALGSLLPRPPSRPKTTGGVFISYRRADSGAYAQLLKGQLGQRVPLVHVFMDLYSIEPGAYYRDVIRDAIGSCAVLIALIGPQWAAADGDGRRRRRLDDPDDLVRYEIRTALERGIRVIPVLVGGASSPREGEVPDDLRDLPRLNSFELSHGQHFDYDVGRLLDVIERLLAGPDAID